MRDRLLALVRIDPSGRSEDERGAMILVIIALYTGFLLLAPIFVDWAVVHQSRRIAQNGADAGALAAAEQYARMLSQVYTTVGCYPFSTPAVLEYQGMRPAIIGNTPIGAPFATMYTMMNDDTKPTRAYPIFYYNMWPYYADWEAIYYSAGIPIAPVTTYVHAQKRIPLIYEGLYGGSFNLRAKARGEAYILKTLIEPTKVGCCDQYCTTGPWMMQYDWRVRLIKVLF